MRWETNVRNGACCIETPNKYNKLDELIVSTTHGGLYVFQNLDDKFSQIPRITKTDADELPIDQRNHANDSNHSHVTPTVWCVKHLPQNKNILATCGGSGNMRLWLKYVLTVHRRF